MTDGLGNPLKFILSSGNRNDICLAKDLLEDFDLQGKLIIADKGYDSREFVEWVEGRGGIIVIPSRATNREQRNIDKHTYNERHLIENLFLKMKNHRRFATRYEKLACSFYAVTLLVASLIWLS